MSPDDPASILTRYTRSDAKVLFVNFFGGEPTLEMETVRRTVAHLRCDGSKTVYLRLTTNGTLRLEDLDYLIDNGFSIVVSSDGPPNESSPHHKDLIAWRVERTIRRLVERGAAFRVRCTVTTKNLASLPEAIRYWSSLGIEHGHIEPFHPSDTSPAELALLPSVDEYIDIFKQSLDVAEEERFWIQTGAYMNLLTPSTYFCTGASGKYRVFNPDGSITTCYRVQHSGHPCHGFIVGRWKGEDGDHASQWKNNDSMLRHHSVDSMRDCDNCPARLVCAGGCPMRNLSHGGAIDIPDPWICRVRRELFEDAVRRTWRAVRAGQRPVVLGRFVFENDVVNNPAIGKPPFEKDVALSRDNITPIRDFASPENVVDIFDALGLDRWRATSPMYCKISRAECI